MFFFRLWAAITLKRLSINLIPHNQNEVKPDSCLTVPLKGTDKRLFQVLVWKKAYYQNLNKLHGNGSFFASNRELQNVLRISERCLQYRKRTLKKLGKINFRTYQGRGKATDYWILEEPQEKPALNPDEVRTSAKNLDRETVISLYMRAGYHREEIEVCLGPKEG